MHLAMNSSKIAFASLAVGAIILLSVSISEKDAGTNAKRALRKTVVRASKTYNNRRLQNTKVNCGFVHKVIKELRNCVYYPSDYSSKSTKCGVFWIRSHRTKSSLVIAGP